MTRGKIVLLVSTVLIAIVCSVIFFLSQRVSKHTPAIEPPQSTQQRAPKEQAPSVDSATVPAAEIESTANEIDKLDIDQMDTELSDELDF
ncbi:hypothetical protein E6P97_01450 [Patescibacteria group bacterium]|nr:MAG: hypothetical protein E6P97_01450 [Patescibacteria group bacterium]